MLSIVMLSVAMLSVIILIVVVPFLLLSNQEVEKGKKLQTQNF
jgi:hypothetical protein